jgi:hypothetical protein
VDVLEDYDGRAGAQCVEGRDEHLVPMPVDLEGLTNAEIAARLVISEKTDGHHVSAILGKLGVGSRYEAAKLATQDRELVPPR